MNDRFRTTYQAFDSDDTLTARLLESIEDHGFHHIEESNWRTDASDLASLDLAWSHRTKHKTVAVVERGDGIAYVTMERGVIVAVGAGATPEAAAAIMGDLRKALPVAEQTDDPTIPVRFWALSPRGPMSVTRALDAPPWEAVEGNYAGNVRTALTNAARNFRPSYGGQLLLWHGEPGTGKTWAIRSLAWEWRKWCDAEYIVDPEQFFGAEGAYLMQVLLEGDDPRPITEGEPVRWRLLIMEDTGELLTVDAAERSGKALSRFLNVVDGFIGQGLRVLVLLTTNEHIERLHPAVARPGRTAMELPFGRLSTAESKDWAAEHGVEVEHRAHTLAELYAVAESRPRPQLVREVGFGRAS